MAQQSLYQYQRLMWLSHMKQLRMMIREGRQVFDARRCLREAQGRCARLRSAA